MNFIASSGQLRASFLRWSLFAVPAVMLLGFLGGQFGSPQSLWFLNLEKPGFYPPGSVFGIVWTVLYVMIGLAVALVASAWGARGRAIALIAFIIHFALNVSWHGVFFAGENISAGLILLLAIDATLLIVIALFWRVRRSAGLLLLPYLAWVLFATFLNYEIMQLNPDGGIYVPPSETQRIEI
ncbi:MAG: TspO/MBR family protein [Erythrobacter sp.]